MNELTRTYIAWKNKNPVNWIFYALLVAYLYAYAASKLIERGSDFNAHARFAEGLLKGAELLPHFLYQIILIFIHKITGMSFTDAIIVLVPLIVFLTFAIAYKGIKAEVTINNNIICLGVMFLLLFHPIAILAPLDKHLYLGYIAPNVYHNLTLSLLKPIALLHFILLCEVFCENMSSEQIVKNSLLLSVLTVLSIIAKPNYIIVLLPALVCYMIISQYFLRQEVRRQEMIIALSIIVPAVILLLWQYLWFYGGRSNNRIDIDLFGFFEIYSELWTLVPKLLLSLAFPISVVFVMGGCLWRRKEFQLSVIMFCISLFYAYVLVETINNDNIGSGNFMWSAQIAYLVLLYVCIKNYLVFLFDKQIKQGRYVLVPAVIGACHLLFGVLWYYSNLYPKYWLYM